jgi:hypothetical protein
MARVRWRHGETICGANEVEVLTKEGLHGDGVGRRCTPGGGGAVKAGVGVDVEGRGTDRNLMVVAAGQKVAEGVLLSVRHHRGGRSWAAHGVCDMGTSPAWPQRTKGGGEVTGLAWPDGRQQRRLVMEALAGTMERRA